MIAFVPAFLAGWLLCVALLIIFHLLFDSAPEEIRYCLGAGSICAGSLLSGLLLDAPLLAFGPAIITSSGLVIIVWQYAERHTKAGKERAERRQAIAQAARGLTQELIDQGGRDNAQRPGHGRQN